MLHGAGFRAAGALVRARGAAGARTVWCSDLRRAFGLHPSIAHIRSTSRERRSCPREMIWARADRSALETHRYWAPRHPGDRESNDPHLDRCGPASRSPHRSGMPARVSLLMLPARGLVARLPHPRDSSAVLGSDLAPASAGSLRSILGSCWRRSFDTFGITSFAILHLERNTPRPAIPHARPGAVPSRHHGQPNEP